MITDKFVYSISSWGLFKGRLLTFKVKDPGVRE